MSLINQMLRDLDARRGPAGNTQLAALETLGPVQPSDMIWRRPTSVAAWGLGTGLLLLLGVQLHHEWANKLNPGHAHTTAVEDVWTVLPLPEPKPHTRRRAIPVVAPTADESPAETAEAAQAQAPREVQQSRASVEDSDAEAPGLMSGENTNEAPEPAPAVSAAAQSEPRHRPNPVRSLTAEEKADRLFAQAQRTLAARQWPDTESLLRRALDVWPRHMEARTQLASLLTSRQASHAAEQLLAEGLAVEPLAKELVKPYAQLLANRGAMEAALEVLDEMVSRGGSDAEIQALRAAILQRVERHAEAAAAYQQALHEQPQQAVWWTGLAIAQEHNGEPQRALRAYRRAAGLPLSDAVRDYVERRVQALQTLEGY